MTRAAYRNNADQCRRVAENSSGPERREAWLRIAELWLEMADEADLAEDKAPRARTSIGRPIRRQIQGTARRSRPALRGQTQAVSMSRPSPIGRLCWLGHWRSGRAGYTLRPYADSASLCPLLLPLLPPHRRRPTKL